MEANTQQELDRIYQASSFARSDVTSWQKMKITKDKEMELGVHIYVPECSYLGETMISLADTYERSGEDCFFIQELIRLYQLGKLVVKEDK